MRLIHVMEMPSRRFSFLAKIVLKVRYKACNQINLLFVMGIYSTSGERVSKPEKHRTYL